MHSAMRNSILLLRRAGWAEAVSFILLVGIAMPLKYVWGKPEAVRIFGMLHGILFLLFCAALARAKSAARWPLGRTALVFMAALVPFGPFLIDRRLRAYEDEPTGSAGGRR